MSRLASARDAWDRFWFDPVDMRPYALVRIGVALAALQLWFGTLPLVRQYYSDAGELPIEVARTWSSEFVARYLMWDVLGAFPVAATLFVVWGAGLLALLLGWRTAAAAWVTWLGALWFFYRNATFNNGGDEVLRLVTLYLALGYLVVPVAARSWSLDRRAAEGPPRLAPAWPLRFVQIQICVVYVVSGFWKVVGDAWWDGSALHYALANDAFSRFGALDAAWVQPLYAVATIATAWWELLFPILVLGRRTRVPALLFGVALHGGILVFMNIGIFPFIMLACYPAFLTGGEAQRVADRVRELVVRARSWRYASASRSTSTAAEGAS